MKKIGLTAAVACAVILSTFAGRPGLISEGDKRQTDTLSYAMGAYMGYGLSKQNVPLRLHWFDRGMEDAYTGKLLIFSLEEGLEWLNHYFTVVLPIRNRTESEQWIEHIEQTEPGVQRSESGLLYRIEKEGDREVMVLDDLDRVRLIYTLWNHHGEKVDSSGDGIAELTPKDEIKGFAEGMRLVGKGGVVTGWVPYELGYGEQGTGGTITPYAALRFEIEVVDVIPREVVEVIENVEYDDEEPEEAPERELTKQEKRALKFEQRMWKRAARTEKMWEKYYEKYE